MSATLRDDLLAQSAIAGAASGVAGRTSVFSGIGTFVYSMLNTEYIFALIGAITAVATFLVNSHYRRKQYQLEERRFKLDEEMKHLAEQRKLLESQARIEVMRSNPGTNFSPLPDTHL